MDIYDIRKARLRAYIDTHYGGKVAPFAAAVDMKREQVYRWLTTNPEADTRRIQEDSARRIEGQEQLIAGSLDNPDLGAPFVRDALHVTMESAPALSPMGNSYPPPRRPSSFPARESVAAWPFELVERRRYDQLSPDQKVLVQQQMNVAIALCESGTTGNATARNSKRPA